MYKRLLFVGLLSLFCANTSQVIAQFDKPNKTDLSLIKSSSVLELEKPNMQAIQQEDYLRDKAGMFYRIGVTTEVNINTNNQGIWTTQANGDRVWTLNIKQAGAEALSFYFDVFKLYDNAKFEVVDQDGYALYETQTRYANLEHGQKHLELCAGDQAVLRLTETKNTRSSEIKLAQIGYGYRSTGKAKVKRDFGDSESCQVNVNCAVGSTWQDEKRGVARILVSAPGGYGWCTGSLVNNTNQDCKPYFLTAMHCALNNSNQIITASYFNNWKFYFAYEATGCSSPSSASGLSTSSNTIDGCVMKAHSNDAGGDNGSDFVVVQLGTAANEAAIITKLKSAAINAYWNGWDVANTATTGGAGIHHPSGDIKKLSTFTGTTASTTWNNVANTHWRITWTANTSGHGVTEGGSSGSPLFNNNGGNSRIIGTLTGGSSYCAALTSPDLYGKMSYHWTSNGTNSLYQLKPVLDPGNTGLTVLNGSNDPCNNSGNTVTTPIANFTANVTNIAVGASVQLTDLSLNSPTSWSWSITPGTAGTTWTYTNSTSASSQNPTVTFAVAGTYTVALTASNSAGSNTKTSTAYITVSGGGSSGSYCAATSQACTYEFISKVSLGTINNTTACNNYTFYSNQSTNLTKGQTYTAQITTSITNSNGVIQAGAYTDDEIAIWIDWNNDGDFNDAGERVGYRKVATGFTTPVNMQFTVPTTAAVGSYRMRVRISYFPDEGTIDPCGTTTDGEVEDYIVNVKGSTVGVDEITPLSQVSIYPVPAQDELYFNFASLTESDPILVELFDLSGKQLIQKTLLATEDGQLNISNLSSGFYQVKLTQGNNSLVHKITKQ